VGFLSPTDAIPGNRKTRGRPAILQSGPFDWAVRSNHAAEPSSPLARPAAALPHRPFELGADGGCFAVVVLDGAGREQGDQLNGDFSVTRSQTLVRCRSLGSQRHSLAERFLQESF
jgi:hypothetical protein